MFWLKAMVTPGGRTLALNVTGEENPPMELTVTVVLAEAPGSTVRLLGEKASWKLLEADGARSEISPSPVGLPHPVTRSYPDTALK